MRIKLTREEVLAIYDFLRKLNLKFANKECAVIIVSDMLKIKDKAQKITQENTDIIEALQDDEFKEKTREYLNIKNEVSTYVGPNGKLDSDSELYRKFEDIKKNYKPMYDNFIDTSTKAILELDQEFEFDLKQIKLEDLVDIMDKCEIDYTVDSISMIYKIIR